MRRELPSGTVTFLFTDIEGSTKLLHELGDAYADTLAEHRRLLRAAFVRHGGVEVDTQGDAFFVAFARASDALAAAEEGQRALAATAVRVRMGVHTGEPTVTDEGYVGMDVHRGARVAAVAHGGQVIVSQPTRDLVDDRFDLRDLGAHRLKDLTAPVQLFQLGGADFPLPRTLHATNLPIQPTPLVGRDRELEEAGELLRSRRVVTLTGPGGSGKTRLALQIAADAVEDFPDGVWWVSLQGVHDAELVPSVVAQALGGTGDLASNIGEKRLLLLLDNLEQVTDAAPALADLLERTPNAKLLMTSREPLRLPSEQRFVVDPLPPSDATQLFVERARAVDPAFQPTPAVGEICRRLDGLPLAIELAAARTSVLPPEALLERLDRRLPLLTGGARTAPERQRTLRAAIEWSHDLLDDAERRAFRRLAAFAASFTLEAAELVAEAGIDVVQSLVDKSLVRRWASGRFGMLETIHEYASELLDGSDEGRAVRRAHAEHFLELAERTGLNVESQLPQRHDVAIAEQDNLRAAIDWSAAAGDVELALRIAVELENFWAAIAPFEGVLRLERLLAAADAVPALLRARAIRVRGSAARQAGDEEGAARAFDDSLAAMRAVGDDRGVGVGAFRVASLALNENEIERAKPLLAEALEIARKIGFRKLEAQALTGMGEVAWLEGEQEDSLTLLQRGADLAGEVGFRWWRAGAVLSLAEHTLELGLLDHAEAWARQALEISRSIQNRQSVVFALALLAATAAARGEPVRAGLLLGALDAEERTGPVGQWEAERERYLALATPAAGPDFERARERARELPLDAVLAEALGEGQPPGER